MSSVLVLILYDPAPILRERIITSPDGWDAERPAGIPKRSVGTI